MKSFKISHDLFPCSVFFPLLFIMNYPVFLISACIFQMLSHLFTSLPSSYLSPHSKFHQRNLFPHLAPKTIFSRLKTWYSLMMYPHPYPWTPTLPAATWLLVGSGANEEEPLADFFSNDDYLFAADAIDTDGDPNIDLQSLLPLDNGCRSSANTQAEIALADLSSSPSSLWTRGEETTCPNPSENLQQNPLDVPDLTNLLQVPGIWMPKKPSTTDMELREGIELPPPLGLPGSESEDCFYPHPAHCCCSGERAFSGRTVGGLIRVVTIEDCTAGMKFPSSLLFSSFLSSLFIIVDFSPNRVF